MVELKPEGVRFLKDAIKTSMDNVLEALVRADEKEVREVLVPTALKLYEAFRYLERVTE